MRAKVIVLLVVTACAAFAQADAELACEPARFATEDGVQIVGDYYPAAAQGPAPAVVLLHIYRSDRGAWRPLVPALHNAGFAVLAIDMRGHGESTQPSSMQLRRRVIERDTAVFNDMHKDVAAAYGWLAKKPKVDLSQWGLIGASVGCSVALDYVTRDRSVDSVVCLTPGEKYLGVDSVEDVRRIAGRSILLLATEGERKDSDILGRANASAMVRIVGPGVVHGTQMFGRVEGIEDRIAAFLAGHVLRGTGDKPVAASIRGNEYFAVGSANDIKLDAKDRRLFSSVEEARARGLTGPDSPLNGKMIDTARGREDESDLESPKPGRQGGSDR